MKWQKLPLALLLAFSLVAAGGCGGDDDNSDPTGPGDLPGDEASLADLDTSQVRMTAEDYFLEHLDDTFNNRGNANELLVDGFVPDYHGEMYEWTGPDSDGWYHLDLVEGGAANAEMLVRWTPDIWADTSATLTKGEVMYVLSDSSDSYGAEWSYWAEYTDNRTRTQGGFSYESTANTGMGSTSGLSYTFDWSGVSVSGEDYAGHYESSGVYPYIVGTQVLFGAVSTNFDFNADGSGSGSGSIGGEEMVRYTIEERGENDPYMTGYYTLATENWEIQHPFEILL